MSAQIKPVLCALQAHKMSSGGEHTNPELMSVAYEVGGSVAPGLKGHILLSEHNGRWKESVTNGHTEPRHVQQLCVYLQQSVLLNEPCLFKGKWVFGLKLNA